MYDTPLISVVVPTYNRPKMLLRALESLENQVNKNFEVVVVDDGSISHLSRELLPASLNLSVVKLRANLGVSNARNEGANFASGKWVLFLDDDDELVPCAIGKICNTLRELDEYTFFWTNAIVIKYCSETNKEQERYAAFEDNFFSEQVPLHKALHVGTGFGFCINREIFLSMGGFRTELKWAEDTDLIIRLFKSNFKAKALNETLVNIHDHFGDRLTDLSKISQRAHECERILDLYADYLIDFPLAVSMLTSYLDMLRSNQIRGVSVYG